MLTVAVLNAKGGCGKTTIATNLAALFALQGRGAALCDLDAQKSARRWLERRPRDAPRIHRAPLKKNGLDVPDGVTRVVIDGNAAMDKDEAKWGIGRADLIVVPILASLTDRDATRRLLDRVARLKRVRRGKRRIVFVANRYRRRTRAATELEGFLAEQEWPVLARLRDTQLYTSAGDAGLSIFELRERRAREYAAEWQPLADDLEQCADD
mgnify:CR=1 FL=1